MVKIFDNLIVNYKIVVKQSTLKVGRTGCTGSVYNG